MGDSIGLDIVKDGVRGIEGAGGGSRNVVVHKTTSRRQRAGLLADPFGHKINVSEEFRNLLRDRSVRALERVIEVMESSETSARDVLRAAELLLAYAIGRPTPILAEGESEGVKVELVEVVKSSRNIVRGEEAGYIDGEYKEV